MSEKTCSKCGQKGHNVRRCGKPKVVHVASDTRHCRVCGGMGHNARTCKGATPEPIPEKYRILEELKGPKVERKPIDGITPHKGLWLVNPEKKRCAGVIAFIRRSGEIVWKDFAGILVESDPKSIAGSGYKYLEDKPLGEDWIYLHLGGWDKSPHMREIMIGDMADIAIQ